MLDPAIAFGKVLRALRKEAGLSQEELGLEADIQRNFVSLMERGINQPTIRVLFKISVALGTKPSAILALIENELQANKSKRNSK